MAFIFSAGGKKIPLRLSDDDVAVVFDHPKLAQAAAATVRVAKSKAVRAAAPAAAAQAGAAPAPAAETVAMALPRHFGSIVLLHERGSTNAPIRTVAGALKKAHAIRAQRASPVYVDPESSLRAIATLEISVRFKARVSAATLRKLLQSLDLTTLRSNEFNARNFIVTQANQPDEWKTLELANKLSQRDEVEYAAPNFISEHRRFYQPNDPLLATQWHLSNPGNNGASKGEDVGALLAWDISKGGDPGIVIAIVDDGVDLRHPDLKKNIWTNPQAGAKDKHGRNFFDEKYPYDPSPRHFRSPYDKMDGNDIHGTCCAGVAGAVGDNNKGVTGIAYRCKILPVKVFGGDDLATDENVANAIRYAGQHADVISISWGSVQNPDLESAINETAAQGRQGKGLPIFCATGNEYEKSITYPSRYPGALAVGASNDQGKRAKYSNYGTGIQFVAPSSDEDRYRQSIVTTDVSRKNRGFKLRSAYTDDFGGTSSATPLAAGIAALVLSVKRTLKRNEVRDILRSTADKIDKAGGRYSGGKSLMYGYGRLNAFRAVTKAAGRKAKRAKKQ